jgi:hypothetical protein
LQPLTTNIPQLHNGYIYASALAHEVDGLYDQGHISFVEIDAGFEVAPGDASDIEVANAHTWSSSFLVFSDGAAAATRMKFGKMHNGGREDTSFIGMSCYFLNWILQTKSHVKTGKKFTGNHLLREGARVAAKGDGHHTGGYDVLLRRKQ